MSFRPYIFFSVVLSVIWSCGSGDTVDINQDNGLLVTQEQFFRKIDDSIETWTVQYGSSTTILVPSSSSAEVPISSELSSSSGLLSSEIQVSSGITPSSSSTPIIIIPPSSSSTPIIIIPPSSSSVPVINPSSSSVPVITPSSSSVVIIPPSSSSVVVIPSSSSVVIIPPSSSSVVVIPSSSSVVIIPPSSSSVVVIPSSSSSVPIVVSSSSITVSSSSVVVSSSSSASVGAITCPEGETCPVLNITYGGSGLVTIASPGIYRLSFSEVRGQLLCRPPSQSNSAQIVGAATIGSVTANISIPGYNSQGAWGSITQLSGYLRIDAGFGGTSCLQDW